MAKLNDPEHLENEINTPNPRENCEYYKELDYELDLNEEEIDEFVITDGQLPLELELDSQTGEISGTAISPDDWDTKISEYVLDKYSNLGDDDTPFPGSPELTWGELKSLDHLHLSGKNYAIMGIKAYYSDKIDEEVEVDEDLPKFWFEVTLKTKYIDEDTGEEEENETSEWFYIEIVPNTDPESFIKSYGNEHNNLKNDDMEILSPEEYIEWRKSQGHTYPSGCE